METWRKNPLFRLALGAFGAWIGLLACPKAPPTPPSGKFDQFVVHVPPGCGANLTGEYIHQIDPSYRYLGADDGGTFVLRVLRTFDDAGTASSADTGTAILLFRRPEGFFGAVHAKGFLPSGSCDVKFPTEIVACDDVGIVITSVSKASIDDRCETARTPIPLGTDEGLTTKHRLVREF